MVTNLSKTGKEKGGVGEDSGDSLPATEAAKAPKAPPANAVTGGAGGRYRSIGGGLKVPVSDDE